MKRLAPLALGLLLLLHAPTPAPACSLCGSLQFRETFRHEIEQAKVVLYGAVIRSELASAPGSPAGTGSSEFQILRILKTDPALGDRKTILLPGYLPVLDPKNPPRLVHFFNVVDGQLKPLLGRGIRTAAALQYVEGMLPLQGKSRTEALLYFFRFLDSEDTDVATDAFLEFARSSDAEVGAVAPRLPADGLRRLLTNPKTPPERLGLYAFLLSAAGGGDRDAELLRAMIQRPTERTADALGGLLCGYINLRPREGWDLAAAVAADAKRPFSQRFAVAHALRFYHGWKPAETKAQVLRVCGVMLVDGAIADLAVEDLRKWKMWDLTATVLAQFGKPSHDAPIARRSLLRYALCCPLPEARQFVEQLRRRQPDEIRELEESLEAER